MTELVPSAAAPDLPALSADAVVERWVIRYASEHTQRAYRGDLAQLADFLGAPPWTASAAQATAYVVSLRDYAPATADRRLASARRFYAWLHDLGALRFNPFALERRERTPDTLAERLLTQPEVARLFSAASVRDRVLLVLLYHGTCRRTEAVGVNLGHLRSGVLTIHGKGRKTRAVRLTEGPAAFLTRWADFWGLGPSDPLLFKVKAGERSRIGGDALYDRFKALAASADLPTASPHWMRHAHATHAIAAGAELTLVAATMGHADVKTSARYVHVSPERSSAQFLPSLV